MRSECEEDISVSVMMCRFDRLQSLESVILLMGLMDQFVWEIWDMMGMDGGNG